MPTETTPAVAAASTPAPAPVPVATTPAAAAPVPAAAATPAPAATAEAPKVPPAAATAADGKDKKGDDAAPAAAPESLLKSKEEADAPKDDASKKTEGKPAKVDPASIEVKLPEGVVADEKKLGEFKQIAADFGLDSEKAQRLVDFQASLARESWTKTAKEWETATRKALGSNFDADVAAAQKAVAKFGGPELVDALGMLGLNPVVVKAFSEIGKAISEDSIAKPTAQSAPPASAGPKTATEAMQGLYTTMQPKE